LKTGVKNSQNKTNKESLDFEEKLFCSKKGMILRRKGMILRRKVGFYIEMHLLMKVS
jgi:hypothetical protein